MRIMHGSLRILFRADASEKIGFGHIYRCIALSAAFRAKGAETFLITRRPEQDNLKLRDFFSNVKFLESNQDFDTDERCVIECIREYDAAAAVTDMSHPEAIASRSRYEDYLNRLMSEVDLLAVFDGTGDDCISAGGRINPHLVIAPYFGRELWMEKFSACEHLLAGPEYFIFREEYTCARKKTQVAPGEVRTLLVTMGGSDPFHLSAKIMQSLEGSGIQLEEILMVIGPGFSARAIEGITELSRKSCYDYQILYHPAHLADLMLKADAAITAGGLTLYELALIGTPAMVLSNYAFNLKLMAGLDEMNLIYNGGLGTQADISQIRQNLNHFLKDQTLRERIHQNQIHAVDGRGTARVVTKILEMLN